MTYRYLTDLDAALAAAGVPYTEVPQSPLDPTFAPTWRERGRPPSIGPFDPAGVLCHHTASPVGTPTDADLNVILAGNSQAPGPVAQLFLARDAELFLVAAGRANHGGSGIRPGLDSACTDMNGCLIGIEVANNGVGERWPDAQTDRYAAVVAALIDFYGWTLDAVYLHATTGPPAGGCNSKIDPAGPWQGQPDIGAATWDLDVWRRFINDRFPYPPQPPPGDDDMATPCGFITCNIGTVGHHIDGSTYTVTVDGTYFRILAGGLLQWVHDGGELDTMRSVMAAAGLRTDTWNTPVGDPDVFGALVGDVPGR